MTAGTQDVGDMCFEDDTCSFPASDTGGSTEMPALHASLQGKPSTSLLRLLYHQVLKPIAMPHSAMFTAVPACLAMPPGVSRYLHPQAVSQ